MINLSHKVHVYLEYHSVCPLVGIGTPHPLSCKQVCPHPPGNKGGGVHTPQRVRGWGSPNWNDWTESLGVSTVLYSVLWHKERTFCIIGWFQCLSCRVRQQLCWRACTEPWRCRVCRRRSSGTAASWLWGRAQQPAGSLSPSGTGISSVADPVCLSGSQIEIFSIPDPNFFHPESASKNLSILTQEIVFDLSEIWSGWFILDPDPDFLPIADQGVKKAPDHGSGSVTLGISAT